MSVSLLKSHIGQALTNLGFPDIDVELEHPSLESHGDYSTNVALKLNDNEKGNPKEIATKLVEQLQKDEILKTLVSKIEIAGPGFINFWLSDEFLLDSVSQINNGIVKHPQFHFGEHKRLMVEFAHFNTHKAVHIGHLRNITLGESLCRVFEALGNTVVRTSYGGDVGLHIAKCIYGLKTLNMGKTRSLDEKVTILARAYTDGHTAFEDDKVAEKEILEINKKIYAEDQEVMPLWKETRQWSFDQFDRIYKRLNTTFDRLYYESEVFKRGLELSRLALTKGILTESKGAVVFKGGQYGLDTRVFITQEGNPTYEGKELGIAEKEFTENGDFDKVVHVVAPEQASFFKVTFKVEELLSPALFNNKQFHFAYGYVRLAEGKMSSRKGTIVLAEWFLDEVKNRISKLFPDMNEESAEKVAVAATKYAFLKIDANQDISFNIDQSVSLEGNSGPYLQYSYARCQSLLSKAGKSNYELKSVNYELTNEELGILRTLYRFRDVVFEAGKTFSPNLICNFLYDLAQKYNLFYQKIPILKSEEHEKQFRLALTAATATVLKNGLTLLGIPVLEKM